MGAHNKHTKVSRPSAEVCVSGTTAAVRKVRTRIMRSISWGLRTSMTGPRRRPLGLHSASCRLPGPAEAPADRSAATAGPKPPGAAAAAACGTASSATCCGGAAALRFELPRTAAFTPNLGRQMLQRRRHARARWNRCAFRRRGIAFDRSASASSTMPVASHSAACGGGARRGSAASAVAPPCELPPRHRLLNGSPQKPAGCGRWQFSAGMRIARRRNVRM